MVRLEDLAGLESGPDVLIIYTRQGPFIAFLNSFASN